MPQLPADAAKTAQARRVRLVVRAAGKPQLTAAVSADTASAMSSTAIVAWSPPIRSAVHTTNATDRMPALVAAIVKAPHPRKPKPPTTRTDSREGDEKRPVSGACRRAGA